MLTADAVKDKLCDIKKNDIEFQPEPNAYEKFEEYVKQVELNHQMIYLVKLRRRGMLM